MLLCSHKGCTIGHAKGNCSEKASPLAPRNGGSNSKGDPKVPKNNRSPHQERTPSEVAEKVSGKSDLRMQSKAVLALQEAAE
jgi:hypothetical protein